MKRVIVVLALLMTIPAAYAGIQNTSTSRKKEAQPKVEGVVVRKNRARAKAGYVFVKKSENLVVLQKRGSDITEATYKCSCGSRGSCTLTTQGRNIICSGGSCDDCSLVITLDPPKDIQATP